MNFLDKDKRASGILLHITSLPNQQGIGTLGKEACDFVDYLVDIKQTFWQVLPLGHTGYGDSPYQTFSAFAGNPILIDLNSLLEEAYISKADLNEHEEFSSKIVEYGKLIPYKYAVLEKAYNRFLENNGLNEPEYLRFLEANEYWIDDYALFMSLKDKFGGKPWLEWESEYKLADAKVIEAIKSDLDSRMNYYKFMQYIFFQQWFKLKTYANNKGIKIIGDIPIYVSMDSVEAWSKTKFFYFDKEKNPIKVAGVPPDYFSPTGQLWGNPLYNWNELKEDGFSWWIERVRVASELYDVVRIDHFRGFAGYYAVPYGDKTAENGWWEDALGDDLFATLQRTLGDLPIIAEDLGTITEDVLALRDKYNFPGMKIIQFGFDSTEGSPYIPHLFDRNSVAYTGTHDNDTIVGWYKKAKAEDKDYVRRYMNITDDSNINWDFIRLAYASVARLTVFPMQDILGLDSDARMNFPGKMGGNWQWRLEEGYRDISYVYDRLGEFAYLYKR